MEKISNLTSKRAQFLSSIAKSLSSKLEDAIFANMASDADFYNVEVAVEKDNALYQLSYSWSGDNAVVIMKVNRDSNFFNVEEAILSLMDFYEIENRASTRYERELQCA